MITIKQVDNGYILREVDKKYEIDDTVVFEVNKSSEVDDQDVVISMLYDIVYRLGENNNRYSKFRISINKSIGDKFEGELTEEDKKYLTEIYEDIKNTYEAFILNKKEG